MQPHRKDKIIQLAASSAKESSGSLMSKIFGQRSVIVSNVQKLYLHLFNKTSQFQFPFPQVSSYTAVISSCGLVSFQTFTQDHCKTHMFVIFGILFLFPKVPYLLTSPILSLFTPPPPITLSLQDYDPVEQLASPSHSYYYLVSIVLIILLQFYMFSY